jgi:tRNA 2-selenouridine synthase
MKLQTTTDFKSIVLNETPLIDVRAPIEFEKGAFRNATNLPIMDNDQRHEIGIKYKEKGNEQATELGYNLISGENKESKINAWVDFIDKTPEAMLYCFRGGQRSSIAQEWIQQATGKPILRLEGGYKAFRNYLIDELEQKSYPYKALRLGGYTGSGKTILLNDIENAVDLEGLAHHRGSSFGRQIAPQPSQIDFENNLSYDIIQTRNKGFKHLIFEDEGRNVGRCNLPKTFFDYMRSGGLIVLDVPFEKRVDITHFEYVTSDQQNYLDYYGQNEGLKLWHEYVTSSIERIKRRLGGEQSLKIINMVNEAMVDQNKSGNPDKHKRWVASLLADYYDPMYSYQMGKNDNNIIFKGDENAVLEYIKDLEKHI